MLFRSYPLNQFIYDSGPTKICLIDSSNFSLGVFETMSIVPSPKTSVINNISSLSSQPKTFIYNYGYPFLFLNQFPVWYPLNQFIYDSGPTKICLIVSSNFSLRVFETMSIVSSPKTSVINNIPSLSSQPKTFFYNYGYPFLFLYFFCIP